MRRQAAREPEAARAPAPGAQDLLTRRDAFMAKRIGETLPPGATGILFVGALHDVARFLPEDISVEVPLARRGGSGA